MKYILLIGDGMTDRPIKKLGNKTCLQTAKTPNMDKIASGGETGKARTVPPGFSPGSDVAILSIFGYEPSRYFSGRAPLEAAAKGIRLYPNDIAYRCNLVTLKAGTVMEDFSAGHITDREARTLINGINRKFGSRKIIFYPGVSYRHLMIWKDGKHKIQSTPPHDITNKKISRYLPSGNGSVFLKTLMDRSAEFLKPHPVNKKRTEKGLRPANSIWLWGQGKKPAMPTFNKRYGIKGSIISAVDLVKGIGVCAGFNIINVKGATGYLDTNYSGKARAALNALKRVDFACVHVEAPDEAGHTGNVKAKIRAIEDFDSKVVGPVLKGMKRFKDYRILVMPDHATPINLMTHSREPVPFAIYSSNGPENGRPKTGHFSEKICNMKGVLNFQKGHELMDYFIKKTRISTD